MRPLSLATFAELEGAGIPLASLSGKNAAEKWARLFAHLAGSPEPDAARGLLADLLKDPIAFKVFQNHIQESLQERDTVAENSPGRSKRRQVKNPLEEKKRLQREQGMREEESDLEPLDMTYLLLMSRMSGISLNDLSRMTFRGIGAVQEFLKDNPPDPPLGGLLGGMG